MYYRITFSMVLLAVLLSSCKKESGIFPDNSDLKGSWDEISSFLDRDELYFDGQDTLFFGTIDGRPIQSDTFLYRLDKQDERLYLTPWTPAGAGETSHKIYLNKEKNELSIWGLHSYYSGEQKFKKLY